MGMLIAIGILVAILMVYHILMYKRIMGIVRKYPYMIGFRSIWVRVGLSHGPLGPNYEKRLFVQPSRITVWLHLQIARLFGKIVKTGKGCYRTRKNYLIKN